MLATLSLLVLTTFAADPGKPLAAEQVHSVGWESFAPSTLRSSAFGKVYTTSVQIDALARLPKWKETDDNPPLSARAAMRLAHEEAKRIQAKIVTPGVAGDWRWQSNGVRLCQVRTEQWYWLFSYAAIWQRGGSSGPSSGFYLVVLMDGTVIAPEVSIDKQDSLFGKP